MRVRFPALLLALSVMSACTGDPAGRPATWSYLHAAVIAPNCATSSCHSALAETAGLSLSDPDNSYHTLLSHNFIIPGDPSSALMSLLDGEERRRMPPDAPLPAADIELVRLWIEAGAPK